MKALANNLRPWQKVDSLSGKSSYEQYRKAKRSVKLATCVSALINAKKNNSLMINFVASVEHHEAYALDVLRLLEFNQSSQNDVIDFRSDRTKDLDENPLTDVLFLCLSSLGYVKTDAKTLAYLGMSEHIDLEILYSKRKAI